MALSNRPSYEQENILMGNSQLLSPPCHVHQHPRMIAHPKPEVPIEVSPVLYGWTVQHRTEDFGNGLAEKWKSGPHCMYLDVSSGICLFDDEKKFQNDFPNWWWTKWNLLWCCIRKKSRHTWKNKSKSCFFKTTTHAIVTTITLMCSFDFLGALHLRDLFSTKILCNVLTLDTTKLDHKGSPLKTGRAPEGKNYLPTNNFQGRTVSFREGNLLVEENLWTM